MPFDLQAFEVTDGEGEVEFRGVQLIVGDDVFSFLAEDADGISALREFAYELSVWGAMAGDAKGRSDLHVMIGGAPYYNVDLEIGLHLVDLKCDYLTIDVVALTSTPRTMATVSMPSAHLRELISSFEALLDDVAMK